MSARLAVIPQDVARGKIFKASYCLEVNLTFAQQQALVETSLDRGLPAGRVLARQLSESDEEGRNIEILSGWHYLEAYGVETHRSAYVNVSLIEADDADAVHYAIENAFEEAKSLGYQVSVIEYAEAVLRARERFADTIPNMTQMPAALRIARPMLVNRVRLLDRLCYYANGLVRKGQIDESTAKTLAAVEDQTKQARYAEMYINNPMSKRAFYSLVNPEYQPRGEAPVLAPDIPRPKGPDEVNLLNRIQARFGTQADLIPDQGGGEGSEIRLSFFSAPTLLGLAQRLAMIQDGEARVRGEIILRSDSNKELDELLRSMRVTEDDF